MKSWLSKYIYHIILLLILLSVRIAIFTEKEELHPDEVFSLTLSQHNKIYWAAPVDSTYQGRELKQMLVAHHSYCDDIKQLWTSNGDTPHASLYYMFLRTALIGYDSYDMPQFALRGFILNSIFFIIAYILLFQILSLTIKNNNRFVILATLALAFGNEMSISNTLLVREYQLAEVAILLLTFFGIKSMIRIRDGENISWLNDVIPLSIAIALTASTGYFNCFYIGILGLCLITYSIIKRNYINIVKFICSGTLGTLLAWGMYLSFFNFLIHDTVHTEDSFSDLGNSLYYIFTRDIFHSYLGPTGLSLISVAFILFILQLFKKKASLHIYNIIPIFALITLIFIQWGSVLKEPRYGYAFISLTATLLAYMLVNIMPLYRNIIVIFTLAFYAISPFFTYPNPNIYKWEQNKKELSKEMTIYDLAGNQIVYLIPYLNDSTQYEVENKEMEFASGCTIVTNDELTSDSLEVTHLTLKPTYFVVNTFE